MTLADTQAVKTLIGSVPILASKTFVTVAPVGPLLMAPYVLIHPTLGTEEALRLTGPAVTESPSFTAHLVGEDAEQVQILHDLLKPKFVTAGFFVPPAVSGRRNSGGYWRCPIAIQYDQDLVPPLVWLPVEFGWVSDPS